MPSVRRSGRTGASFGGAHRVVPVAENSSGALCFISSGQMLPNHQMRIVSESGANRLGAGGVGEILIQSDCLFEGYYNRPDLTAQAIIDGWYHTGDLGFIVDGELLRGWAQERPDHRRRRESCIRRTSRRSLRSSSSHSRWPCRRDGRYTIPRLGTEDIVVVAEVENGRIAWRTRPRSSRRLRESVMQGMGIAVRMIYPKASEVDRQEHSRESRPVPLHARSCCRSIRS